MKAKHISLLLILGSVMIFLGAIFKIQHWPGGKVLLLTGCIITATIVALVVGKSVFGQR